mmetsp:Transcript_9081/g.33510  ORF Transcript_9081/g.33510 Transcript_9081/m.33510 type:complete len:717 (-) Transcript_9081:877-3027(-)
MHSSSIVQNSSTVPDSFPSSPEQNYSHHRYPNSSISSSPTTELDSMSENLSSLSSSDSMTSLPISHGQHLMEYGAGGMKAARTKKMANGQQPAPRKVYTSGTNAPSQKHAKDLRQQRSAGDLHGASTLQHRAILSEGSQKVAPSKKNPSSDTSLNTSGNASSNTSGSSASSTCYLLPSLFGKSRPSTVVFSLQKSNHTDYEREFGRPLQKVVIKASKRKDEGLYYCMPPTAVEFNVIKNAFKRAGFKRTKKFSQLNMLWGKHMKYDEYSKLNENQRCNHFPGSWALGRKDNLHKHLTVMRRRHGKSFDFFPHSYLLPEDKSLLQQEMDKHPQNLYILKPRASSCGRGIKVVQTMDQIKRKECIIQRYIADPFLIDGKKWDLRIYVVVTSMDPLVIYMFDDGLTRFATEKYNKKKLNNRFIHLTNYSINKNSKKFDRNEDEAHDMAGSKWSIKALKRYFQQEGIDDRRLWKKVSELVVKTMIAVESNINSLVKRHVLTKNNPCYEVFGFDVLVDAHLKPWIIEVNVSPSLSSSSPLDKQIKGHLITQTFHMLGCTPYKRRDYKDHQEQERRDRLLGLAPSSNLHSLRSTLYKRTMFELQRSKRLDFLTDDDRDVIMHFEDEHSRRGNFERIFPTKNSNDKYGKFFENERYNNVLLGMWLKENSSRQQMLLSSSAAPTHNGSFHTDSDSTQRSKSAKKYRSSRKGTSRVSMRMSAMDL